MKKLILSATCTIILAAATLASAANPRVAQTEPHRGDWGYGFGLLAFDLDRDGSVELYTSRDGAGSAGELPALMKRADDPALATPGDAILRSPHSVRGMAPGDFDGDGDVDLYLLVADGPNILVENRDGEMVQSTPVLLADRGASRSAAWADFDRDGDLDLYVSNGMAPDRLFVNEGDGEWSVHTSDAIPLGGNGYAVNWVDLDADGQLDLHVVQAAAADLFLRQTNEGDFERVEPVGYTEPGVGLGAAWGDVDGDGLEDVVLSSFRGDHRLLRNLGQFAFEELPGSFDEVGPAFSVKLADLDLDGRLDLHFVRVGQPPLSLLRTPAGSWASPGNEQELPAATATALADLDGDGDLDLSLIGRGDPVQLPNEGATGHWLRVHLDPGNAAVVPVGATIQVFTSSGQQHRVLRAGDNFVGDASLVPTFGLGDAVEFERIEIRWPNGDHQLVEGGAADREITVVKTAPLGQFAGGSSPVTRTRMVGNTPNPFNPVTTIHFDVAATASVSLVIYDLAGRKVRTLVAGEEMGKGRYRVRWDGVDDAGLGVASGVYHAMLEAGDFRGSQRMVLVK